MFRTRQFSGLLALALATGPLTAGPSAQKNPDIPVTVTIADRGAADQPLRVQSDRKGAYVTKAVKQTKQVDSALLVNPTGTDWSLTTYYVSRGSYAASDRTVFFDLREQAAAGSFVTPILGTDALGAAVEYGYVTAHLIAKCSMVNVDMTRMATGATASCPGSLRFRAPDGLWYRFSFQPDNFPQVDRFLVTCSQANSTGCRVWTVTPGSSRTTGTDSNTKSLNTLLAIDEAGNILSVGGDYYLSFSITVAR
jgi:hypothetical protein